MKAAIRVDASGEIGTGHFMRCLTLADALKQKGANICFLSRHLPEHFQGMLREKEYELRLLAGESNGCSSADLPHSSWLGASQEADARESIKALSGEEWDWLVVDHYALDARWESDLRKVAKKILVIDDLADRQHDCDLLLDQNLRADIQNPYDGRVPAGCRLLLGPRFALLRDEFRQLRDRTGLRTGPVRRVLVFFGGVDSKNHTGPAIQALADRGIKDLRVDVVIGEKHPLREQIKSECAKNRFDCHVQTTRMAELMAASDLAIGAGGSATWERCCLGLPTFAVCTADNQAEQIAGAASETLLYAPEINNDPVAALREHLNALMENSHLRNAISRNGMRAVDGRGAFRVIAEMGCPDIEIRAANEHDAEQLFSWRNHPDIRAASRHSEIIPWEDHQKWFSAQLASPDALLVIGERGGSPVGVVRFDVQDDSAEISIYLVPGGSEPGSGRALLRSAESWFVSRRPGVDVFRANVLGGNERSRRFFSEAGFQIESTWYFKRISR